MKAVITGDVIQSRDVKPELWMPVLKKVLSNYGKSPAEWEVYRGDGFQLKLDSEKALLAAFHIKAAVKTIKGIDARISIGLGLEEYKADRVSESNGEVYQLSGWALDSMKKHTMVVRSADSLFNKRMNTMLNLAGLVANSWSVIEAEVIRCKLENPTARQADIAKMLGKTQGPVSLALNRSGFQEILDLIHLFNEEIEHL